MEPRLTPDILTLEGGTDRLSRNVSKKLLIDSTHHFYQIEFLNSVARFQFLTVLLINIYIFWVVIYF